MKIRRSIFKSLQEELKNREVSILIGPRQVGKTFLLKELENETRKRGLKARFFNLEIPSDLIKFNRSDSEIFNYLTEDTDVIFIDEFHYLKNASKLFKAIYDSNKMVKIFASGSSSIEMHKHLKESLAGRRFISRIFPLNYEEFLQTKPENAYEEYLLYGGLPGLIHFKKSEEKIRLLNEILETYIQKDIKSLVREENIRAFNTILYLIAENQGSVSVVENLSREVGLTAKAVAHHLEILEKTFVVIPVHSYAKNIGNELKKSKKYYFYDTGIRNILLKDFSKLTNRDDSGVLNESFIFLQIQSQLKPNMEVKFWRDKRGQEIDFVILKNRKPFLIEVKTNLNEIKIPLAMVTFMKKYPETIGGIVFSNNIKGELEYNGKKIMYMHHEEINGFLRDFTQTG